MRLQSTVRKVSHGIARGALRPQRRTATSDAAAPTGEELSKARSYCLNLLKQYDHPAHTLQAFIPKHALDAFLALRALNVETARVADYTSTPTVGAMRMQFWRDAVTKSLAGRPPKEPVAVLLACANDSLQSGTDGKHSLSAAWLTRLIKERERQLGNPPYVDMTALERYAENTYSTLLYLTLQALPVQSVTADHVASHIGKATGIAAVLRGLPLVAFPPPPNKHSPQTAFGGSQTRQGAVTLPLDVMAEAGVRDEDVLRQGADAPGLRDAVFAVATRANDHLITAREMVKNLRQGMDVGHEFEHEDVHGEHRAIGEGGSRVQKQLDEVERLFGVLLQAVPTARWLEKLEQCDFDVFDAALRRPDWRRPWQLYWAFKRRRI